MLWLFVLCSSGSVDVVVVVVVMEGDEQIELLSWFVWRNLSMQATFYIPTRREFLLHVDRS